MIFIGQEYRSLKPLKPKIYKCFFLLLNSTVIHFVYVFTSFPFIRERFIAKIDFDCALLPKMLVKNDNFIKFVFNLHSTQLLLKILRFTQKQIFRINTNIDLRYDPKIYVLQFSFSQKFRYIYEMTKTSIKLNRFIICIHRCKIITYAYDLSRYLLNF